MAYPPWSIRLDKMRQLAEHGKIGQDRVWDQVETFLKRAKVSSRTLDLTPCMKAGR